MNLPLEIIYYIYEFDPSHREKMTKVHHEMNQLFDTYNTTFWSYKQHSKRLIWMGKYYGQSIYAKWFQTYGYNYKPHKYILYKLQHNHFCQKLKSS